jgi:exodeoxyribonuclease VII small subunit
MSGKEDKNESEEEVVKVEFEQLTMFSQINERESTAGSTKTKSVKAAKPKSKVTNVESPSTSKEKENMQAPDKGIDFEASLTQLEVVVKELDGEVKLEEALKLFEEGIKLSVECEKFIKSAEQKIEILKKQADGSMEAESFAHEAEKLLAGD